MTTKAFLFIPIALIGPTAPDVCRCSEARLRHGWCTKCGVGFVAGVKIESQKLYEAVHPHGHEINPDVLPCPTCKKAAATDGYCYACRMGFVARLAYFSRLTHCLAVGQTRQPGSLTCPACIRNSATMGWCDACKVGMVGNVAIKNRADFDDAAAGMSRLLRAIQMLKRCETCAVASYCDGICIYCKISYQGGVPTTQKSR